MARMALGIDAGWFEHLLNCMANQKFIHEFPEDEREEAQSVIDDAWLSGMEILHTTERAIAYPVGYGCTGVASSAAELRERIKAKLKNGDD